MRVYQGGFMSGVAVTPNDSADLTKGHCKAIFVGTGGNIAANMADGSSVTFTGLTGGIIHLLSIQRIKATGTTATNIVALY